ncbi:TPA: hypothetical protein NKA98_003189 [Vibrio parahaemolyticus]|nr:hypothetical protein [Vibrio parahaemolyticus]
MSVVNTNKAKLSDVSAGGHVSGRDTIVTEHHYHSTSRAVAVREDKTLKILIEEHEQAILTDCDYREFSETLNNFLNRKISPDLRDLTTKLTEGDRSHLVMLAMMLKEDVTKKIMRHSHFESAQKIYTHLLRTVYSTYLTEIYSKVKSAHFPMHEIDEQILERIVTPILDNVGDCSLLIDKNEVYGLLYILTGNCYIEWK